MESHRMASGTESKIVEASMAVLANAVDKGRSVVGRNARTVQQSSLKYIMQQNDGMYGTRTPGTGAVPSGINAAGALGLYIGTVADEPITEIASDDPLMQSYRGSIPVIVEKIGTIMCRNMTPSGHILFNAQGLPLEGSVSGRKEQPQKGDIVVIGFINGTTTNGVILGSWPDSPYYDDLLVDKDGEPDAMRRIDVHPSFLWEKINKQGDLELKFPDGTFVSFREEEGQSAWPLTPPDKFLDLTERRERPATLPAVEAKTVTVLHASGTWVKIRKDGTVDVVCQKDLNIKVKGNIVQNIDGDYNINLPVAGKKLTITGEVVINGNLTASGDTASITYADGTLKFNTGTVVAGGPGGLIGLNTHKHNFTAPDGPVLDPTP